MSLTLAIAAHRAGDHAEAERQYRKALDQGHTEPFLFQNFGALLRKAGRTDEAAQVFDRGLALHPRDAGILGNRANLYRETAPTLALADSLAALRTRLRTGASAEKQHDLWLTAISLLRERGCSHWALALGREALRWVGEEPRLLAQLLLLLDGEASPPFTEHSGDVHRLRSALLAMLGEADPLVESESLFVLAYSHLSRGSVATARQFYESGLAALRRDPPADQEHIQKRQQLLDVHSWNMGCTLLKAQELQRGWQLYEYGLRTPADGKQRWQRSLVKPFAGSELPLWRGESLQGRRLLLLGEQAIGDSMMFLSLVPSLVGEAKEVGVFLGDRLLPIYRRCFGDAVKVWSQQDATEGRLRPDAYDLQSPLGSICQYRFTRPGAYAPRVPMLQPKAKRHDQLRREYLSHGSAAERLIGVSWQGGGKPGRIEKKSLPLNLFEALIKPLPGVRFVSLQYGNVQSIIGRWRDQGFDVLYDPRVNPLKDMNLWLDQVAACDAVLSVANTTIHGAGGLNLPTLCLLSRHSDWRWFDAPEVTRSYWYPSVGITRQTADGDWGVAMQEARTWLEVGCPRFKGAQFSPGKIE